MMSRCYSAVMIALLVSCAVPAQDTPEAKVTRLMTLATAGESPELLRVFDEVAALGDSVIPALVESLSGRSERCMIVAMRCLQAVGAKDVPESVVLTLAASASVKLRTEALILANYLELPTAEPTFVKATRSDSLAERRIGYNGLVTMQATSQEALAAAVEGSLDSDFWISQQAFRLLAAQAAPPKEGSDPLVRMIGGNVRRMSPESAKRLFAFLGQRSGPDTTKLVLDALDQTPAHIAVPALKAAEKVCPKEVTPIAISLLAHQAPPVVEAAANFLGNNRQRDGLRPLITALQKSEDLKARSAIANALRRITGKLFGYHVELWEQYLQTLPT